MYIAGTNKGLTVVVVVVVVVVWMNNQHAQPSTFDGSCLTVVVGVVVVV
jgi:hypothetical protein